jgi:prepilin-type N-terminal cleavage/methylation domain-containing protein
MKISTPSRRCSRGGYTAIELMLVLSIVSVLSMMSAPSVVTAMRKAAITEAADVVVQGTAEARNLALRNHAKDDYYGVVVGVDDLGRSYAALTYGQEATESAIMKTPDGRPVLKLLLKRTVRLVKDGEIMAQGDPAIGWMHQYTTGAPISIAAQSAPAIAVGTPTSSICQSLGMTSLDGRYRAGVAVYPIGLTGVDVDLAGD